MAFVPVGVSGCGALGSRSSTGSAPSASSTPGGSWIVVAPGSATPSAGPSGYTSPTPSGVPSFLGSMAPPSCPRRINVDEVLIPITVVPGRGSFTVTWPRVRTASGYRIAAVPQNLIKGSQPPVNWKPVATSTGCTVTGTITGLKAGEPYIVWLDVLGAGYQIDGTRRPYSGRSAIVYVK